MNEQIQSVHKIESGIPMPRAKGNTGTGVSAALRSMSVGDSTLTTKKRAGTWHSTARGLKMKVACRVISGDTVRVWRTQ